MDKQMKYQNGTEIHINDKIMFEDGSLGVVVFSIDTDEHSREYPKDHWDYLGSGVLVFSKVAGLIYYASDPVDFVKS